MAQATKTPANRNALRNVPEIAALVATWLETGAATAPRAASFGPACKQARAGVCTYAGRFDNTPKATRGNAHIAASLHGPVVRDNCQRWMHLLGATCILEQVTTRGGGWGARWLGGGAGAAWHATYCMTTRTQTAEVEATIV